MATRLGKHFARELHEAGMDGLPFSWGEDGALNFGPEITAEQRDDILALAARHDPENNPLAYRQLRAAEYPPVGDQLDAILGWISQRQAEGETIPATLAELLLQREAIKKRHPKPTEENP